MIKILTSCMGLGTYVPALMAADGLKAQGNIVDIELIEEYMSDSAIDKMNKSKEKYHLNYKAAVLGHKLAGKRLGNLIDNYSEKNIYHKWEKQNIEKFIIFSGNWMHTVKRYADKSNIIKERIIIVYMDAGITPSWSAYATESYWYTPIKVYEMDKVNALIGKHLCRDFSEVYFKSIEEQNVYVHGGGWGMGTYLQKYESMNQELPYQIKGSIHKEIEAELYSDWECYLVDPLWYPWKEKIYPRIFKMIDSKKQEVNNESHQGMISLYSSAVAIISKSGGSTLMESLITGRPIIFLEAIADHEKKNQELWCELKFGMTYEAWKQTDFSVDILYQMHKQIITYRNSLKTIESLII